MNKLSGYVIKTALWAMLGGVGGLWLLQLVFAYLSELQDLSDSYTLMQALSYVLYRSPYYLVEFTPTGVLLGAVVGLGILSGNSEIVAMRAAGVSLVRLIGWAMLPALLFVAVSLAVNEWVLPISSQKAANIRTPKAQIATLDGYWALMDEGQSRQIVYIQRADALGNLNNVKVFNAEQDELTSLLSAKTGVHQDGYDWQLNETHKITLNQSANSQDSTQMTLTLPIAKTSVHLLTKEAEDLSISELYQYQKLMAHQGARSKRHELAFYQKLLSPLSVLSLLLIACSFVFGSLRSQSLGFRIVIALLTGLLFSYIQDLTGFIALATRLSPLLMALLPVVLGAVVGIFLLNKKS